MRCLDEHIARRANREDGCKGRFWEGRFTCRALVDEAAVLTALVYVDLNSIRAGVAATPEASAYTSVAERIGSWPETGGAGWLCPMTDTAARRGVFRRLQLADYLTLLDRAGRVVRADKPGAIPPELAPILDRLALASEGWLEAVRGYEGHFRRLVGRAAAVRAAAEAAGRRWFQGITACQALLGPPPAGSARREM
jgi:hypothetical protein